eukprot:66571_1
MKHLVSFNVQSVMVKGNNHTILNNIGFNATYNNGYKGGGNGKYPPFCIRHLYGYTNIYTLTMNNGADSFSNPNAASNGCVYPLVGNASNNIAGRVEDQLVNPQQFDFRPKPNSIYAMNNVGAYYANSTFYWIPGRKEEIPSFPIPKNEGNIMWHSNGKYVELIWRNAYKYKYHIANLFDSFNGTLRTLQSRKFYDGDNIWKIYMSENGTYLWRIDVLDHSDKIKKGDVWSFRLLV